MAPGPPKTGSPDLLKGHDHTVGGPGSNVSDKAPTEDDVALYDANCVRGTIALALRKELLHLWANADPTSVNALLLDVIVSQVSPSLVHKFVHIANSQVPGLAVQALSPLPETPARAAGAGLGSPSGAAALAELLEELQGTLASLDLLANRSVEVKETLRCQVAPCLPPAHPWQSWLNDDCPLLLPADAVLGICMVAAPALLAARTADEDGDTALVEVDTSGGAGNDGGGLYDKESLPAGAPQGLARAVRCRRRVFALERELVAREKAEFEREAYAKAERQRAEARLMEANRMLEDRLKARTDELKRAEQRVIEAQTNVDQARAELNDHKREIAQLRYQLDKDNEVRREAQIREKEHSRSLLRAAARENLAKEKTRARADKLQKCLDGSGVTLAEILNDSAAEASQQTSFIDQIEADFALRIRHRKEQYDKALEEFQREIEVKRQETRAKN